MTQVWGGPAGLIMEVEKKKLCELHESDIPALVVLEEACFARPWTFREFEISMRQKSFYALGVRLQHTIIAYVTFFLVVDELEIVNFAVLEAYRCRGLGQFLLGSVISFAGGHDVARILLEVRRSNQAARGLYVKNGFKIIGVRNHYYPPDGEDALLMEYVPLCISELEA